METGATRAARVEARDLCKSYGGGEVLADCSLRVDSGEFVTVVGRSGCGKSTLLGILGLLARPDSGRLSLCGEDVLALGESRRARVRLNRLGFVFQSYNLVDELTVEQNVEFPLVYKRVRARDRRREVGSLLERLDLEGFEGRHPRELSGGEQQRVAIARAVAARPEVILADEPTGNLDEEHGREVLEILAGFCRDGAAVVMATHSQRPAQFSDRVLRLEQGRLIEAPGS